MQKRSRHNYGPYEPMPKAQKSRLPLMLLGLAAFVVLGLGVWRLIGPDSMARAYGQLFGPKLEVESLTLNVNQRPMTLMPGAAVDLHPGQSLMAASLVTNRWRNYDLRLYSPDFDVASIQERPSTLLDLMGPKAFDEPRQLRIRVMDKNTTAAEFTLDVALTALDFSARGDAAPDPAQKTELYKKALDLDPGSAALKDKYINALWAAGQKDKVAEIWEAEIVEKPDQERLAKLLDIYGETGDVEKQMKTLRRLADLPGTNKSSKASYLTRMAELYKKEKRGVEAAAVYEELLKDADDDGLRIVYLEELAAMYRDSRQTAREIETRERILKISPPSRAAAIWAEIAKLYESIGDEEGQRRAWQNLAQALPPGQDQANAYKRLGFLWARAERPTEAREAYRAAARLDPQDATIFLNLARLSLVEGDRPAYRANLQKILALDPRDAERRLELAESFMEDGLTSEAKAEYQKILELDPKNQTVRLKLIRLLESEGAQTTPLIAQYEKLLETAPGDKVAAYNFGVLCFQEKDWTRAIEAFNKVIALDPADLQAHAYLLAAYKESGRDQDMLAQAWALFRLAPDQLEYRDILSARYEKDKNWPALVELGRESLRLRPQDAVGWRLQADGQIGQGQKLEAAQSLLKIAELSPGQIGAWLEAADAFKDLGDLENADKAYLKVLAIDPANVKASEGQMEVSLEKVKRKTGQEDAPK